MRLAAITSVLLVLAPMAAAQPYPQDRRIDEGYRPRYGAWRPLATGNLAEPAVKLLIGRDQGRFTRIRIRAVSGAPRIRFIEVRFLDNSVQRLDVHRRLFHDQVIDLDLWGQHRAISSITVVGRPDPAAAFEISGQY